MMNGKEQQKSFLMYIQRKESEHQIFNEAGKMLKRHNKITKLISSYFGSDFSNKELSIPPGNCER